MPYRNSRKGQPPLPQWKDLNAVHKSVRARVEHAVAHMKSCNILCNCRANATASGTLTKASPNCATRP